MNKKIKIDRFYPEEIILQIAQFLSVKYYTRLSLVNKFWFNLINNINSYKLIKNLNEIPSTQYIDKYIYLKNGMIIVNKNLIPNKYLKEKFGSYKEFINNWTRCFFCGKLSESHRCCPGCGIYFCSDCDNQCCPSNCNFCSYCNKAITLQAAANYKCFKCCKLFCSVCKLVQRDVEHSLKFHGRIKRNTANLKK
jgi:hypothetical protein